MFFNETAKNLREAKGLTQRELADRLGVSDKAISKWETGRGMPDIAIWPELARALGVSVSELMSGEVTENRNRHGNMLKTSFYVCPVCGNIIHSVGEGVCHCCGITLRPLEAEAAGAQHPINVEVIDGEYYVSLPHEMSKRHYISFIAYATADTVQLVKLYPEQDAACRFTRRSRGIFYAYCNRHGLFTVRA